MMRLDRTFGLGILVGAVVGAVLLGRLLESGAALDGGKAAWFTSRSAGMTAYLLLTLSTVWGLLTSSRLLMRWVKLPLTAELHKVLSFLSLGALALHGGALLFDRFIVFQPWQVALPFLSPYRPVAVGVGVLAGYLMVMLVWSFYVRQRLGQKVWRAFHYTSFLAFVLATGHGLFAGTDTSKLWAQLMYLVSGAVVLFLTYVRILGDRYVPARTAAPAAHGRRPVTVEAQEKVLTTTHSAN